MAGEIKTTEAGALPPSLFFPDNDRYPLEIYKLDHRLSHSSRLRVKPAGKLNATRCTLRVALLPFKTIQHKILT